MAVTTATMMTVIVVAVATVTTTRVKENNIQKNPGNFVWRMNIS
jgi:hypothetical protein